MNKLLNKLGYRLAHFLTKTDEENESVATCSREALEATLKPGDILLIEGASRISMAIKYITQSTWSHAALFIGKTRSDSDALQNADPLLIEADVTEGVRTITLRKYCKLHARVCRPVGLSEEETQQVIDFMMERIGHTYDLKNIVDLARYLIQTPPVPQKHRRKLLALGSGDPTKAICTSLIAQAFQSINYPILPVIDEQEPGNDTERKNREEILHIRHHSLFAPRDFDVSPYFEIIKPSLEKGFDHHRLNWAKK